jgi:tape measure domain-containing protein
MAAINLLLEATDRYSAAITGLNQGLELVGKSVKAVGTAADLAMGGVGLVFKALTSVAGIVLSPITYAFDAMYNSALLVKDAITGLFSILWDGIKSAANFTWDTITSLSGYLYDKFKESLSYIWDTIKSINNFAWDTTKDFVVGFGKSLYETGNTFEQLKVRMEAVFGGSGAAKAALDWAVDFGAKTPLTLDQVASAMVKLKTFGFDPMNGTLQKLGDAAFALGTDFDGVVTALGQMQLKGKVSAEELMQLAERNVPVYEILREKFKLTSEQLGNIGKAGLNVNEAVQAIVDGLGTRFTGAMEKASGTAQGALSTIEDIWVVFQKKIADSGVWNQVTGYIVGIRNYLDNVLGGFSGSNLAKQVGEAISYTLRFMRQNRFAETFINTIMSVSRDAIKSIREVLPEILSSVKILFNEAMEFYKRYIGNIGELINSLAPYVAKVIEKLPDVRKAFLEVVSTISSFVGEKIPYAINLLRDAYIKIESYSVSVIKTLKDMANYAKKIGLTDALFSGLDRVYNTLGNISNIISQKITSIDYKTLINNIIDGFKTVVDYAGKLGAYLFDAKDVALKIFKDTNDNMPAIQSYLVGMFKGISVSLMAIGKLGISLFSDMIDAAEIFGGALAKVFGKLMEYFDSPAKMADNAFGAWADFIAMVEKGFLGIIIIAGNVFEKVINTFINGINLAKKALAAISPDLAAKIPDLKFDINTSDLYKNIKNALTENALATDLYIKVRQEKIAEQEKLKIVAPDLSGTRKAFDEVKESLANTFELGASGIELAANYIKNATKDLKFDIKASLPELDKGSQRIVIKLDDGSEKVIEKGIGISGELSKIELPKYKLEIAKLDLKDKKVSIDIDDSSLDKLKGEMLVSLKDDKEIQSGLNENEILLALTKLLKAQLVADATGEGLPVITYS